MEATQVINWEDDEEDEAEEPSEPLGYNLEPLGRLRIFSGVHGPEKDFPLYLGKNVVGRMPDCSVALPFPSISKQHAVIEIFAWDKAPVLQDCGSLNGTQILRPPKVLSPGMSHRLRNQELILFGDLPCQYYRRDVSLPFVSRGPLTVEETPRVQGGTQSRGLLLAEDSEEEVDSLAERCVEKEPSTTSSTLATVVPESDEEGSSPVQDDPGPPFAFNLDSDTDEEANQPPAAREASSTTETEQPNAEGGTTEGQLGKGQYSVKDRGNGTEVEGGTGTGVVPVGVKVERSQPAGEDSDTDVEGESTSNRGAVKVHLEVTEPRGLIDSDTDVEEGGVSVIPAVVPMKKRQFFRGVSTESPGARVQEDPASSDTDVEEGDSRVTVPLGRSRASVVIDSNTEDEDEVSAALTLACLKESHATTWKRNPEVEGHRAQPGFLKQSQTSAERDSETDVEEEGVSGKKRECVPKGHTDRPHSGKSQPPLGDNDVEIEEENSSPAVHLEGSRASATVAVNSQVGAKHQVHVAWASKVDVEAEGSPAKLPVPRLNETRPPPTADCEAEAEEGTSLAFSVVAGVRRRQLPAQGMPEQAAAFLEWGRSPVAQEKQNLPGSKENLTGLVGTGTPGAPTQPQREGTQTHTGQESALHVPWTKDAGVSHDDSEELDLQATQCFVKRESHSLEVQSMEDEPTQAFVFSQPQEPGPSHGSFQTPGALDEPWEVLATQPFCPTESEASETQPIAAYLEAHGPCDSSPQGQHPKSPVHTQPLGIQGHRRCKLPPTEKASRGNQESPDVCLPPAVPEATVSLQSQKYPGPQPLFPPSPSSLELPTPRSRRNESQVAPETPLPSEPEPYHPEPRVTRQGSSRRTPTAVSSLVLEPHFIASTDQPIRFEPPAWVSQMRTRRSSVTTHEPVSPTEPQPQPPASKDQPATPKLNSQTTRGRRHMSSVKIPELGIPIAPKHQSSTSTDQHVTPEPTPQATRGRTHRSSLKTPEPGIPTGPELRSSTPTDQTVTLEPTSRATRSRTHRSSVKTPEPSVPTASELQASTPTDNQPVTPESTSRATRGRAHSSSLKTPEPGVPTGPELQSSSPTDQTITPEPTSQTIRGRAHRSSVKTPEPGVSTDPEPQPSTSKDQPVTPNPPSLSTRSRTHRSSVKTPEPGVPTAPELQPSTPTDDPVTSEPTPRATGSRTHRSSVKTPEPCVSKAPDLQPSTTTDQTVTPEPTSRATRSRRQRSSLKTPEPGVPAAPEFQPSTPTDQPVIPEPTSQSSRSRAHRAFLKTPEPGVPTGPELQPSTPKDQTITPEPTSRATRSRTHRSSVKTPESIVPTDPEPQPSASKDQPVTPEPTSRSTRGRAHRSSVKTLEPGISKAPHLQPSTTTDQPITPESTSHATRGRAHRSSLKTSELGVPTGSELQPSTPTDHPVTPEPTSRATKGKTHKSVKTPKPVSPTTPETAQGRTHRPSVKIHQPAVPTSSDLEPPVTTDQPISPKAKDQSQSRALRSTVNAAPIPEVQSPVPTEQPIPPESIPQPNGSRKPRTTRKHGSLTVSYVPEPCPATPEPNCQSSRNQRQGAVRASESFRTTSEPASAQPPKPCTQAPQIEKAEGAVSSGLTLENHPEASQSCKRPLATTDSPPPQKRLQRGEVPQKTSFFKEEKEDVAERPVKDEHVAIPGPVKRKRDQTEEPKEVSSRSLRRTKPNQESTAPKVLFTGVVDARGERAVLTLGGSLASSVTEASHLVTDRIRRTVKFLCALGRGIPILSLDWLHQSRKAGCFLPPDEYVVTDPEQEKNFGFSLREALRRAREQRLLEGYEIHVTPGVQPPPSQMGEIISCCGGTVLPSMPRFYKPRRVVITCSQDFPRCTVPCRVGLPVVSPEFLLTGVLRQEATPGNFVLSASEVSSA
ncbi:PREDICTED: mediator of DNA damage checkpoint protein 1 isoform X2 [Condylura cristata]|uniref:mediator of DNA damage checkpoint protein 1 isoform X2 n=1 Tax=Condylura cristata TaxID=143302 RepID=UPI00064306B3|nr:PREDICTED: mediator of DNA damage checkpoint protein 1 isoform X2 [Condylura cristata]